jgi:hypothetical protein
MVQESHRIQWQQWGKDPQSKRDLITRSATVRFTDGATAYDVVQLLAESHQLLDPLQYGVLILVGILYNMPVVDFDHEEDHDNFQQITSHLFHVIYTLKDEDNPMSVRDKMMIALEQKKTTMRQPNTTNPSAIAPKLQWFYIPGDPSSPILKHLELDGYATTMEEEDMEDDNNDDDDNTSDHRIIDFESDYIDPMGMPWLERDSTVSEKNSLSEQDAKTLKQWQRWQQFRILARNIAEPYVGYRMSGYLCKQSQVDSNVWRRVFCLVSEEYLWFVTRRKSHRQKMVHSNHQDKDNSNSSSNNNNNNRPVSSMFGKFHVIQRVSSDVDTFIRLGSHYWSWNLPFLSCRLQATA